MRFGLVGYKTSLETESRNSLKPLVKPYRRYVRKVCLRIFDDLAKERRHDIRPDSIEARFIKCKFETSGRVV